MAIRLHPWRARLFAPSSTRLPEQRLLGVDTPEVSFSLPETIFPVLSRATTTDRFPDWKGSDWRRLQAGMVWAVASAGRAATWLVATLLQGEATSSGLDDAKTVADIVGTLITALAVIVGAVWAYYRFFKDRTYRPRLEVSMGGEWVTVDGERLLLARVQIKNIGSSVVELLQKGTGLRVSPMAADASESDAPRPVEWVPGRVYKILEEHAWIEPGETVSDDVLVRLTVPDGQPVLFETRLVWKWSGGKHNIVVFARQVLLADAKVDDSAGE